MTAHLQQNVKGRMNYWTVRTGLEQLGHTVLNCTSPYGPSRIEEGEIFYGNVNFINNVMERAGIKRRPSGFVPEVLRDFAPPFMVVSCDKARKMHGKFLKPAPTAQKAFQGFINDPNNQSEAMLNLAGYEGDVIVQAPMRYCSEWRIFILRGKIAACQHYRGDFRVSPSWSAIDEMMERADLVEPKVPSWSMDVGIDYRHQGNTWCIEVHDPFSLGAYGVQPEILGAMLESAWEYEWEMKARESE